MRLWETGSRERGLLESDWKFLVKAASQMIGAQQLLLVTTVRRPSESGYQGAKKKSFLRSLRHAKNNLSREVFSAVAEMGTDALNFNSSIDPSRIGPEPGVQF